MTQPPGYAPAADQWFVVTIAINGVVHCWGPFSNAYYARKQVTEFKRNERSLGRLDDIRYVVCKALDPTNEPVPAFQ